MVLVIRFWDHSFSLIAVILFCFFFKKVFYDFGHRQLSEHIKGFLLSRIRVI